MKYRVIILALAALLISACSGNFGTGTGMPQQGGIPPMGGGTTPMPPVGPNGLPIGQFTPPPPSPGPVGTASYPISDAQKGFTCPQTSDEYGCKLSFNLPPPTPTPSPNAKNAKSKNDATATPSPSPSPTPSPTPSPSPSSTASSRASGNPSASPSPTPTPPSITLTAQAPPKDAPQMVHVPANTLDTIPLVMVQLTTNDDFTLDGWVSAQFTLPQSQIGGRGFAVQLFQVSQHHHSATYKPIWTFDKSVLNDTTLTFSFEPPKMTIGKGSTYTLVLYGDDRSASPSPSPSALYGTFPTEPPFPNQPNPFASVTPAPSPSPDER